MLARDQVFGAHCLIWTFHTSKLLLFLYVNLMVNYGGGISFCGQMYIQEHWKSDRRGVCFGCWYWHFFSACRLCRRWHSKSYHPNLLWLFAYRKRASHEQREWCLHETKARGALHWPVRSFVMETQYGSRKPLPGRFKWVGSGLK